MEEVWDERSTLNLSFDLGAMHPLLLHVKLRMICSLPSLFSYHALSADPACWRIQKAARRDSGYHRHWHPSHITDASHISSLAPDIISVEPPYLSHVRPCEEYIEQPFGTRTDREISIFLLSPYYPSISFPSRTTSFSCLYQWFVTCDLSADRYRAVLHFFLTYFPADPSLASLFDPLLPLRENVIIPLIQSPSAI